MKYNKFINKGKTIYLVFLLLIFKKGDGYIHIKIIDKDNKEEYEEFIKSVGGQFIEIKPENAQTINIFDVESELNEDEDK